MLNLSSNIGKTAPETNNMVTWTTLKNSKNLISSLILLPIYLTFLVLIIEKQTLFLFSSNPESVRHDHVYSP